MAEIIMNSRAYIKPIFHAVKYPHCSVNGLFLGRGNDDSVQVTDAIPLFHSSLSLAPMLEVALFQIDAYCQLKNLSIVGYYQANEILNDVIPNLVANKIADKIKDNFPEAFLFMLNNNEVMEGGEGTYIIHSRQDNKWKVALDRSISVSPDILDACYCLVTSKTFRSLHDFDNHLDDLTNDWLNEAVNQALNAVV